MADFVSKVVRKSTRIIWKFERRAVKKGGMDYSLFDNLGRRKYLLPIERRRFLSAALETDGKTASFCAVLAITGARISEVLALTPNRIDDRSNSISFETLKQRRRGVFRSAPVPRELILFLEYVHELGAAQCDSQRADAPIWTWSRTTAWRRVKTVMRKAAVPVHASQPKALRHAFGVAAAMEGVIITMVQKWLGHSDIRTTAIYTTVTGKEERILAGKTWRELSRELARNENVELR